MLVYGKNSGFGTLKVLWNSFFVYTKVYNKVCLLEHIFVICNFSLHVYTIKY